MAVDPVDALSRVPLLAGLERADLGRLASQLREYTFPSGASITDEGSRGPRVLAFFIITAGRASVRVGSEEKAILGPGDYFGEIALLRDTPRTATVRAETDLRCFAMSSWEFKPFIEAHPSVGWTLLETMAERLGGAGPR